MNHAIRAELEQVGLSSTEAQVYLALVRNGSPSASAIASATGLSRTCVYQMLCSLADKGLIESGAGYGTRFSVLPPEKALPSLVLRERELLAERQRVADTVGQRLASLVTPNELATNELVQVIRNPRGVSERFDRLQLEAEKQIDSLIKAPFFCRPSNPAQEKALRRGVRIRSIYERAVLDDDAVQPYLAAWIAGGEQARVYDGELPQKLAIFDNQCVLMPLMLQGDQMRALVVKHPQLTQTLSMFFESLWKEAEPIVPQNGTKTLRPAKRGHRRGKQLIGANSNY